MMLANSKRLAHEAMAAALKPRPQIGDLELMHDEVAFLRSCVTIALKRNPLARESPIAVRVQAILAGKDRETVGYGP